MTEISRNNWTFGAQIVTAVGMFIVTLGILFIATLTYLDREDQGFRNEIRTDLTEIRAAMRDMNHRLDNINTRLGRVEGYLRVSGEE
ncbi:MAG: hypothetical protein OXU48_03850 [candidate division Zixibacteria bacterium]|nr:hypothetical protein [candidate division Zixibacteria bacterium]MYA77127.1 hypothetical protein [Gemmatimonadota bacterium]MYH18271.1 hypothetical protein [Gemmatimonadota bacterium]